MSKFDLHNKTQTDANTLSIKLLQTIGSTFDGNSTGKKVISNLGDLSNRLKMANQTHEAKMPQKKIQT